MNDTDLKEWAERIWASVEYGHNEVKAMKDFIQEYERDGVMKSPDKS